MTNRKKPHPDLDDQTYDPTYGIDADEVMTRLKQLDQTDPLPKPRRKKAAPSTAMTATKPKAPTNDHDQRPYVLDSSVVEDDLRRKRDNALGEIEAIEADCLSIETRANNDINSIQARRDAEIAARRHRTADLNLIVAMADRALTPPPSPTEAALAAVEADMEARRAAQTEGNDQ